ncbi:MAG: SpoIIE family protein phosphatase [Ignavibacteria bacterium]|nr:SpoIIE family protein phosphatase [Ignavibacteria bacterium]
MTNTNLDISELEVVIRQINYLQKISQQISEDRSLEELLNELLDSCRDVIKAEASSLLLYNEKENNLYFHVVTGEKGGVVKNVNIKMGQGIAGWVAENRKPLLIEDCYADPRFNREFDKKSNFKTKTMICVPLIFKEKLFGVIQVINKQNDEFFNERDLNIFTILASQCAVAIENAKLTEIQIQQKALERELKTAREIQQNLLPSVLPDFKDIDVSFKLIPAKQVGGDYYNVYKINDDLTLFFICDVSGKSISAALIVSTICSCIMTYLNMLKLSKDHFDLIEMVKSLNRVLIESTTDDKFATAWFGLYKHSEKKLQSVNAGHNVIFIFRNNEVLDLKEGGLFLGSIDMEYNLEEINLEKDDLILCYTDGVNEAMNKNFEQYGDDRLIASVKDMTGSSSEAVVDCLLKDVKNFVKDAEQSDDITCGAIKVV